MHGDRLQAIRTPNWATPLLIKPVIGLVAQDGGLLAIFVGCSTNLICVWGTAVYVFSYYSFMPDMKFLKREYNFNGFTY